MKLPKQKPRNTILQIVANEDPKRYRARVVGAKKGRGRKKVPRNKKNWDEEE